MNFSRGNSELGLENSGAAPIIADEAVGRGEDVMEFDPDWLTRGPHRVRLRSTKGFPTEAMRKAVEVVRIAVDNNMSARARLVEGVCRQEKIYEVTIGTTVAKGR